MLRSFVMLVMALSLSPASGESVYRWVMPDGSVRYSDQPRDPEAVEGGAVQVGPLQTYTPPPLPRVETRAAAGVREEAPAPAEPVTAYDHVVILAPADGDAMRVNNGAVPVRLRLEPALADGHVIEVLLDGAVHASVRETELVLTRIDRGQHTLRVGVRDGAGEELARSEAVSFHLLRTSKCDRLRKDFPGCGPTSPCDCGRLVAVPQ